MKVGDIYIVLPESELDERWWGSLLVLEQIPKHRLLNGNTLILYQFRTHKRTNVGEELVHTTWIFNEFEIKDLLKEVI